MLPTVVAVAVAYLAGLWGTHWSAAVLWLVVSGILRYRMQQEQEDNEEHTTTVLQRFEASSTVANDEWLNHTLTLWWNAFIVKEHVIRWMADSLDETLDYYKPSYLTSIHVHKLLLGKKPPILRRVNRLEMPEQDTNVVAYELDITYYGGAKLVLMASMAKVMNLPIELDQIALFGKVHLYLSLNPLPEGCVPPGYSMSLPENAPPAAYGLGYFKDMVASFVERPTVTFNVRALNMVNLLEMPGIKTWLRKLLAEDLWDSYSQPNSYYLSFEGAEKCEECLGDIALRFCFDCGMQFCDKCSRVMHSKGLRVHHHVIPLSERQPSYGEADQGPDRMEVNLPAAVNRAEAEPVEGVSDASVVEEGPNGGLRYRGKQPDTEVTRPMVQRSSSIKMRGGEVAGPTSPGPSSPRTRGSGSPDRDASLASQIMDKLSSPFPKFSFPSFGKGKSGASLEQSHEETMYDQLSTHARGETRGNGSKSGGEELTFGAILTNITNAIASVESNEFASVLQAVNLAEALDPHMHNYTVVKGDLEVAVNRDCQDMEDRLNTLLQDLDIVHQAWKQQPFDSRLIRLFEATEIKKLKSRVEELQQRMRKVLEEQYHVFLAK